MAANILCLETSSGLCSVALETKEAALICRESDTPQSHSNLINSMIREVCEEGGILLNEIDAIAVSAGPGSYTGLRIGASVSSGIAYGIQKPLIAIKSLRAMCFGLLNSNDKGEIAEDVVLCPMIDARRMEVFTATYTVSHEELNAPSAMILNDGSFADVMKDRQVVFFGSGADKASTVIQNKNARFYTGGFLSATHLIAPAREKLALGQFEDLAYWTPYYLKSHQTGAHQSKKSIFH